VVVRFILAGFLFAFGIASGLLLWAGDARPPAGPPAPVTQQEVWQAVVAELRERGLSEQQLPRPEDLELPVALPALAGRRLRVASACWDAGPRRTQFRLQCGEPGQCLPFLVYLRDSVRDSPDADVGARARSCRVATGSRSVSGSRPLPEAPPKPAVRAGERATAVFLSSRLRMTASVTCLEHGREGEIIRVRGLDGHVFRARISGPALLEALPQ